MSLVEVLLVALALAADAFTVGIAVGVNHSRPRQLFRLSFHFGLFQALLPLVGALFGFALEQWIEPWDQVVAAGLLLLIGARMFVGALDQKEHPSEIDLTRGLSLVGLSLAVSIDALAVGFTLGLRDVSIPLAVGIIGLVAGLLTLIGMLLAGRFKSVFGKRVEILAGIVLIGLGLKILVEYLSG